MSIRYLFKDTLVSKNNILTEIQEFTDLNHLNVISRIPVDGGIVIFTLDTNYNINYGKFILNGSEIYDGEFRVISDYITFENVNDIYIFNGYYDKNESFYIFYNYNGSIYLRTFLIKQGFLSSEVLVKEKSIIKKIDRVKESFFVVYEDSTFKNIFSQVSLLGNGELKIFFLCENDIDRFISNKDYMLNVKDMDNPFNDIGETSWTSDNKVGGDRGFLYISNQDVLSEFDNDSINGSVFVDPGKMLVEMDNTVTDYTLTVRCNIEYSSLKRTILDSENFIFEYKADRFFLTTTDSQVLSSGPIDINEKTYHNISITQEIIDENYILSVYLDDIWDVQYIIKKSDLPLDFKNDEVLIVDNIKKIDYMSLQRYSLSKKAIIDYHNAFDRKLITNNYKRHYSLDEDDFNGTLVQGITSIPLFSTLNPINYMSIQTTSSNLPFTVVYDDGYTVPVSGTMTINYTGIPKLNVVGDYINSGTVDTLVVSAIGGSDSTDPLTSGIYKIVYKNGGSLAGYGNFWNAWGIGPGSGGTCMGGICIGGDCRCWAMVVSVNGVPVTYAPGYTFEHGFSTQMDASEYYSGSYYTVDVPENGIITIYYNDYNPGDNEGTITYDIVKTSSISGTMSGIVNFDTIETSSSEDIIYTRHSKLNSSYRYYYGKYMYLDRISDNEDMKDAVIPMFLDNDTGIPAAIYSDPTKELRVCENISQVFDTVPFIIEENTNLLGVTVWSNMSKFRKQVGFQYGLKDNLKNINLHHTYSRYEALSNNVYNSNSYYFAYHFDRLYDQRRILIKDVTLDVTGEIVLGGITDSSSYIREIKSILFVDNPKRYKAPEFRIDLDVQDKQDVESYINNADTIKEFIKNVVTLWKPATDSINSIVEKNTLVMTQLMRDEFTQVIVGFTPDSNVNAYYIRSVETGQVNILTSSLKLDENIDFIGVGKMDTPYIKSGVNKIKTNGKSIKIYFETSFSHTNYRVFVFNPNNSLYYVPIRSKDGFIVESSSLVETEVAWIALNTYQVRNGTVVWKNGLPLGQSIFDNTDRTQEINLNSNKYVLDFTSLELPEMTDTDYSVILSSDSNISMWVENKTKTTFTIRRSYAGQDTTVHWLLINRSEKWWNGINA